eukprot:CAMPEP_0116055062 /NCGR_PEP_ID=MMETSP0322-20121206/3177_1 /TAXON_ID=163516 /ORGANISM="Leptocylindrus danicus var. apora, Strain B651" /LENGTH=526 /DNA_ID=CAMNT_0003538581 /DNA_START=159 /DNA_END=1739 /DNA_ORIENTATION=-
MTTETAACTSNSVPTSIEDVSPSYLQLTTKLKLVSQLRRVSSVLDYDRTVFMPQADECAADRGAQMAALAQVIHEKATDKEIGTLIERALKDLEASSADEFQEERRVLELSKKSFEKNDRISAELEARKAKLSSESYGMWTKARAESDYSMFEPYLKNCFDVAMEVADAQRDDDSVPLYTQMLDDYETGMSAERIDEIFDEIKNELVPLISLVLGDTATAPSTDPLKGEFPVEKQQVMNEQIVKSIGYDKNFGRIDVSVHPFTSSLGAHDVRITSRFSKDEWYQGLAGSVHEAGHAMYEQNLGNSGLSIDSALSMGVHESQSLFWERHVGLSKPFWRYATPILQESFGESFKYSPEELYGAVNAVSRSFIRVEADELTYPLHVILRYTIEKEVIEGKLDVSDIPSRWNGLMKDTLSVDVPSDSKGCLQDVHWSMLAFGYFPTYLLGAACAAQLAHFCHQDIPDMDEKISNGEFAEIKAWLTSKVHRHGSRYKSLDQLLTEQVGEPLNPQYFVKYLKDKYTKLYGCD